MENEAFELARREYPDSPLVGVGAVVIEGNRVLLVRRGREPLKGEWSIPGGVLELGETLEEGVRREVAEETGLVVKALKVVEVLDKIVLEEDFATTGDGFEETTRYRRVRYHYVLVDFLCEAPGGALAAASDAADARWVEHEELNSHGIYKLAPATAAVIEKAFGMSTTQSH